MSDAGATDPLRGSTLENDRSGAQAAARRLRMARRAAGYTKGQMASLLGLPRRQYRAHEAGAPMSDDMLLMVSAITGCPPGYFRTGRGWCINGGKKA